MTRNLVCLSLCLMLTACSPLRPHDSALGDAAEIAGRTLAFPLTLGTSEIILMNDYRRQQERAAYRDWYNSLPPERQAREDLRDAAALNALGLALSGGGPFFSGVPSHPVPSPYRQPITCYGNEAGNNMYINCY